ncbi:MAG: PAS domain S-box protein [Lachnospiraceae bacterium]|nr:PAS domain S-box protein [Lachnospiraceae bacterium]
MSDMDTIFTREKLELTEENLPLLAQMSELVPGGFFVYCASGYREILFANSDLVKLFGCDDLEDFLELTGKSFKRMPVEEDYDGAERRIAILNREKRTKPEPIEYRIRTKQGELRWVQHYGRQTETKQFGKIYTVFVYDTTENTIRMQEDRRKAEIISGLGRDYNSIYLVDFETHEMIPYSLNNGVSRKMRYAFNQAMDYEIAIQEFADMYVVPEEYDHYLYETKPERIRERIMGEQSYTVPFTRYNEKHVPELVHMTISRVEDKNRFNRIVMSYKTIK